jgi:hypothetical protein
MSASRDVCKQQVLLFRNYYGFPSDLQTSEGKSELKNLIDAFEYWCVSDEHARKVARELLDTQTYCPKTVEIKQAANQFRDEFHKTKIGVSCGNACGGAGTVAWNDEDGICHARRCSCNPAKPTEPVAKEVKRGPRTAAQIIGERE